MVILIFLSILLVFIPLFPDIQLIRPKLLIIELGIFTLLLGWLINSITSGKLQVKKLKINAYIIIYIIYILLIYLFADNKPVAGTELKRMLLCAGMFFIAANFVKSTRDLLIVLTGLITGSVLSVIYGLFQHFGRVWIFMVPQFDRVISTFGNPIFFAVHIVMLIPIVIGMMIYAKKSGIKAGLFFVLALSLITLFYTKTRAAWIAFLISILFYSFINIESKKTKLKFLTVISIITIIFVILTKDIWMRQQAHLFIWRDTLHMWLHSPLFGTGLGTFHINFPKFASPELLQIWPQKERIINDAHNEYIQLLAETGIAGLLLYFAVIYRFIKDSIKFNKKDKLRFVYTGMLTSVVAVLIQNIFSVDMRFIISAVYVFLLIGLMYSSENNWYAVNLPKSNAFKYISIIVILLISGVVGINKNKQTSTAELSLCSIIHYDYNNAKFRFIPLAEGSGLLPTLLKPYLAEQAVEQTPDFFDERVLEPVKTLEGLQELLQKYPNNAKIYEKIAWIYAKERNFPKAIENFEKAVSIDPKMYGPLNNLGNIYFLMNNRKKAIEYYRKSLAVNSGQLDSHMNLGTLYYYEGMLTEAAAELNIVLKLDPGNDKAILILKKMRE